MIWWNTQLFRLKFPPYRKWGWRRFVKRCFQHQFSSFIIDLKKCLYFRIDRIIWKLVVDGSERRENVGIGGAENDLIAVEVG